MRYIISNCEIGDDAYDESKEPDRNNGLTAPADAELPEAPIFVENEGRLRVQNAAIQNEA